MPSPSQPQLRNLNIDIGDDGHCYRHNRATTCLPPTMTLPTTRPHPIPNNDVGDGHCYRLTRLQLTYMPTLREMSASSSVGSVLHGEPLSSMESMPHAEPLLSSVESVPHGEQLLSSVESVPHAEPLPSVEYVLHGKPLSSVESMSSVGSIPHGEPLQLTFDAFALGRATRPKRVKPPGGHRVLSRAQESLAALGMIMELAKHDLLLSPNQQQVFGSRVLEPHSQRVYKKHYWGLWYFFGLIGDYTSLLILRHDCPQHAPAMSVKRLCAYLKYKTGAIGTILHYDDGLPVLDVDGQPVLCDGQWKDPQNMI
ncbi:hypothetical protein DYB31_016026, partial [Aphanomyces astaci]